MSFIFILFCFPCLDNSATAQKDYDEILISQNSRLKSDSKKPDRYEETLFRTGFSRSPHEFQQIDSEAVRGLDTSFSTPHTSPQDLSIFHGQETPPSDRCTGQRVEHAFERLAQDDLVQIARADQVSSHSNSAAEIIKRYFLNESDQAEA